MDDQNVELPGEETTAVPGAMPEHAGETPLHDGAEVAEPTEEEGEEPKVDEEEEEAV